MTVSFVVLCASGSIVFGLLFGRLFAWWQEVKDEEQALANANIRARFQPNYDPELVVDHPDGFVVGDRGAGLRFVVRVPYNHEDES